MGLLQDIGLTWRTSAVMCGGSLTAMEASRNPLLSAIADLGPSVRYGAVHDGSGVEIWERSSGPDSSSPESDRYEELFVNPTLLAMLEARGAEGCGGLDYVIVRYGNFFQIVQRTGPGEHVSVAVSADADPLQVQTAIERILHEKSQPDGSRTASPKGA